MRAVAFDRFGGPEQVRLASIPTPEPAAGQVRVQVSATTVNPADVQFCRGDHAAFVTEGVWPYCGGLEFVGGVDRVGPGVALEPGRRVAGTAHFIPGGRGAHAEYVVVDASWVVDVPEGLTDVVATTIPMNGLTARVVVDSLPAQEAGWLLVTGAAGAVGSFVVELAVARGYQVLALGAPSDAAWLRERGATFIARGGQLNERVRQLVPEGVAAVVDAAVVGEGAMDSVKDGGSFVTLRPGHVPARARGIAPGLVSFRRYQGRPEVLAGLLHSAATGGLTPRVSAVHPPHGAASAYEEASRSGARGRVVLDWRKVKE